MIETAIKYHNWCGIDKVKKILKTYRDDVIVYFDPDVDGMVSGYFVCKFLKMVGKNFQWYVNSDRRHDWSLDISKIRGRDIIAVDFMIPQNTVEDIVNAGCNIISMDHHINQSDFIHISKNGKNGLVINNQYPFEEEDGRYLSGAGVVFETLRNINPAFDTVENRALVGLTLLSDVCDIENPYAKGYLYDLYNHKMKGYIKYLIEHTLGEKDFGFGVPRLDRKYVDYTFSPSINSCLRFNKEDEVVKFFLGSGELDLNYHKRQKALVKNMVEASNVREFSNLRVVFVRDWEVPTEEDIAIISNFIGLLASRYLDGEKSVVAYVISKDEKGKSYVKRASFRGNINSIDYLSSLCKYVNGVGHPPAFGIVDLVPSKELFNNINRVCKEVEGANHNIKNISSVTNLSVFSNRNGKSYAEYNMYCLAQNSKYLKYKGKNITIMKEGTGYRRYKVDGIEVTSFDLNLDFSNGLIYPILERGYIYYYLQGEN